MFSKRLLKRAGYISSLSRKFGASMLTLDEKSLLFKNDFGAHPIMRRNYCMVVFWALASLFMVVRFYKRGELERCNLTLVYWIGGFFMTVAYSLLYWFADDMCMTLNGTILLFRYLHQKYMPDFNAEKNKLNLFIDIFVLVYAGICIVVAIFVALFCVYNPRGVIFLGELFPEEYFYLPFKLLVILYHGYLMIPLGITLIIIGSSVNIYLFYLTVVLTRELRLGEGRRYITTNDLRKPSDIRHVYRSFQLLNANAMCFLGAFILSFHSGFMFELVLGIFCLIKYWKVLDMLSKAPLLVSMPAVIIYWSFILWLGGLLFKRGGKLLGSWKGRKWGQGENEDKVMKKFHRSCSLVVLSYGKQFVVRKVTFPIFVKGVTRGTFRALLTIK